MRTMFDQCLYFNTTALARRLERRWGEAFAPFGLTAPQGFVLRVVLRRPGLLQGELAEAMAISRPTATRALDGLAAKKLLVRRASANDGREIEVHPTAKAIAMQASLDAASASVTRAIRREAGDDAFASAVAQLRELRTTLDED